MSFISSIWFRFLSYWDVWKIFIVSHFCSGMYVLSVVNEPQPLD